MFLVDAKRARTMRLALGKDASEIIKEDSYLPFFRSRQKKYPEEFEKSVQLAKKKRNPYRYLSKIWAFKNLEKTLTFIGKMLSKSVCQITKNISDITSLIKINPLGRAEILDLYKQHGFLVRKN